MCRIIVLICMLVFILGSARNNPSLHLACNKPGLFTFTFDDGVTKNYPALLDILDQEGLKVTFFIEGQVSTSSRFLILKEAVRRGHTIGNHSWTHANLPHISPEKLDAEITKTDELIGAALSYSPAVRYMRPPYGAMNDAVCTYLTNAKYKIVLWNIETSGDWKRGSKQRTKEQLWESFTKQFAGADPRKNSYILLQHDKNMNSVNLVPDIVRLVRSRGFKIVTLAGCLTEG